MGKPVPVPDRLNNLQEEDCEEEARSSCPVPCSRHCQAPGRLPPSSAASKTQQHSSNQPPAPAGSGDRDFDTAGAGTEPSKHRGTGREPSTGLARERGTGACPATPGSHGHGLSSGRQGLPGEHRPAAGQSLERSHGSLGGFLSLGTKPAQDGNTPMNSTGTQARCCNLPMSNSLSPGVTLSQPQSGPQQHQTPSLSLGISAAAL